MVTWDQIYTSKSWLRKTPDPVVEFFSKKIKPPSKVLDLGCGTGRHTVFLAQKGFEVTGCDISKTALNASKKWLYKKKLNALLVNCDMRKLPFASNFFDAVLSIKVVEHATKAGLKKAIGEIYRVLKPGGIALVTTKSVNDAKFGFGRKIEKNTFEESKGLIHHFMDKKEALKLFSKFEILQLTELRRTKRGGRFKSNQYTYWKLLLRKVN